MHFMSDDQLTRHEKWHKAGEHGQALWFPVGVNCAAANREGLIPAHMLRAWAPVHFSTSRLTSASKALVRAGLWHDHDTLCARCFERHGDLEPGDHRFHDWLDWQFAARAKDDPLFKMRENRRKRLHRAGKLRESIRRRDRDLCRYCGRLCVFGTADHKSDHVGQFDHLDPFDEENAFDKIVVACKACNVKKGERTWQQAGMVLHAPGFHDPSHCDGYATDIQPGISGSSSRDAGVGTGTGRDGSTGWIPDQEPARNGNGVHA
jgi:hypothetical protein